MHWILALTLINSGASTLMGSYDSEEACKRALKAMWATEPRQPITIGCVSEDSPILKIFGVPSVARPAA